MAALLTSDQDNIDRVAIEVSECREMGIEVLPPDVNESFEEFAVIKGENEIEKIRFGLNAVKNVGHTVAHEIVEERKRNGKYKTLTNLIERVQHKDLNKKSIEALAKVGALDAFAERNQIISSIENILAHSKNLQKLNSSNQGSLFGAQEIKMPEIQLAPAPPVDKKEKLSWEKELLGLYISDHPARVYQEYFTQMDALIKNALSSPAGRNVNVGGVVVKVQKIITRSQQAMLFVTLEDMDSKIEILVFPKVLESTGSVWEEGKIVMASGRLSDKDGQMKLLVETAKAVNQEEVENFKRVLETRKKNGDVPKKYPPTNASPSVIKDASREENYVARPEKLLISFPASFDKNILKSLAAIFDRCEAGETKIYLRIGSSKLETPYRVKKNSDLLDRLNSLLPNARIEIF
jgi:DNA polymerase-3 subunit alpha